MRRWFTTLVSILLAAIAATAPALANSPPDPPANPLPADGTPAVVAAVQLCVDVSDPEGDPLQVTFHGRELTAQPAPDFTVVAIPDSQFASLAYPHVFVGQTRWIVDNLGSRDIAFVTHLGDCVENSVSVREWDNTDAAMSLLEDPWTTTLTDGIPYGIAVGNHDQDGEFAGTVGNEGLTTPLYNTYFGVDRFAGRGYYGGHFGINNDNHFELFSASGMDFIVLHLEYNPSTPALRDLVLAWADALLDTYGDRRAIVVSHHLLNPDASFSPQGQATYDALKVHPNLFLMLTGHLVEAAARSDSFEGSTVTTLLSDYQWLAEGGQGWLRLLTFAPDDDEIRVETYSPWLDASKSDASNEFVIAYDMDGGLPFSELGSLSAVASGQTACIAWPGRQSGATYEWFATVADAGAATPGPSASFTSDGSCSSAIDCDDGDPCTADDCPASTCTRAPIAGCCTGIADCDDDNPCTDEACDGGACNFADNSDPCWDGDYCTVFDACAAGSCSGVSADCDDGNACTDDACADGACDNTYATTSSCCIQASDCDDGDPCTADSCLPGGDCLNQLDPACCVADLDCDDGNACTAEVCLPRNEAALTLDGTDSFVTLGPAPALGLTTFTLECLFRWNGGGQAAATAGSTTGDLGGVVAYPLVAKGVAEGEAISFGDINYFLGIDASSQTLTADFEERADGALPGWNHPVAGSTPVSTGLWHHAAVTYDGACWQLYLDGQPETDGLDCPRQPPNAASLQHLALGAAQDSHGLVLGLFDGDLDEVRVWSRARSQAEIQATLGTGLEAHPDLLARWSFDEGAGFVAADSTTNGHDAAIVWPSWRIAELADLGGGDCAFDPLPGCCLANGDCDDGNACTTDGCDSGLCEHTFVGGAGCCVVDADCDDADPCTRGTCDGTDTCVFDALDTDADMDPDCTDPDDDGDGDDDLLDNCRLIVNAGQQDADGDGLGDACDDCTDTDGDGLGDPGYAASVCAPDNCTEVSNVDQSDADNDGVGNVCDTCPALPDPGQEDMEGDGVGDLCDNCPDAGNANQRDVDFDGPGDACDNCPDDANPTQIDGDGDDVGNLCDNCPGDPNGNQADGDGDEVGDVCDNCPDDFNPTQGDADGDQVADACDNCPGDSNPAQIDGDGDDVGNLCDNCPGDPNGNQADGDGDEVGDVCDNCPDDHNPTQGDADGDQVADACDNCPGDWNPPQTDDDIDDVGNLCDNCPATPNSQQLDIDDDDEGNVCDLDDGLIYLLADGPPTLSWQDESGYDSWNLYAGDLDDLRSLGEYTQAPGANALAARSCGLPAATVGYTTVPASGRTAFFLVTGVDAGIEGDLGTDSAGTLRPNGSPCP